MSRDPASRERRNHGLRLAFAVALGLVLEILRGARYGSKAAMMVYAGDNALMDAIGRLRMRLIAILTYVS